MIFTLLSNLRGGLIGSDLPTYLVPPTSPAAAAAAGVVVMIVSCRGLGRGR